MVVSLSGPKKTGEIYAPMPCGLHKALMKYKQGTEAASLGSSEMDTTNTKTDYKYVCHVTCQKRATCDTGISSSPKTLRAETKGIEQ